MMARRALESQAQPRRELLARGLRAAAGLAPTGARRAVAQFAVSSFARNRRHLLVAVSYAGVGTAIAAISLVAARLRVGLIAPEPTASFLAVPLVMMFFLTFGIRAAFRLPTEIDANWTFRVVPPTTEEAAAGAEWAMFVLVVLPVLGLSSVTAIVAGWPVETIGTVLLFDLASGVMLLEAALLGWTTVPFTCEHEPSQEAMKSRWLIYLIPLNIYAFRAAALQASALQSQLGSAMYFWAMVLLLVLFRVMRLRRARKESVTFDAPVDLRLEVLNLSEALH
jgi:hypothetical protein